MNFDDLSSSDTNDHASVDAQVNNNYGRGREIKLTTSICPFCLEPVDAQVLERDGEVWMDKHCSRHGCFSALLASNVQFYIESETPSLPGVSCCGNGCGVTATDTGQALAAEMDSAPWVNHSCTILIEIIERCNLSCPTCFAGSSPQHSKLMSLQEFTRQVDQLVAGGKSSSDMIQLSGGEPTIHPQFFEMVDLLFERGFIQVCVNSNGLKLAQPAFAARLASSMDKVPGSKLAVYLQFDGFADNTYAVLRGRKDLLGIKQRALLNCHANNITAHPVMTLTRGVNDHEVGDFVQLAVDDPALKNVVIQPAMYSGRYDNPRRQDRITLADTVTMVCDQFGVFSPLDFVPIPCSDPNCFSMAVAFRTRHGLLPVSRYFPRHESWDSDEARALIEAFSDSINGPEGISEAIRWATSDSKIETLLQDLDDAGVEAFLDALIQMQNGTDDLWDKLLTISIKPFMDAWTYDQDRIDKCCVHILDGHGNPVSFCEFNAVNRPRLQNGNKTDRPASIADIQVVTA
jgi:uncharacterized radical SAM superfamily Fe-S cluster-containing enzyme